MISWKLANMDSYIVGSDDISVPINTPIQVDAPIQVYTPKIDDRARLTLPRPQAQSGSMPARVFALGTITIYVSIIVIIVIILLSVIYFYNSVSGSGKTGLVIEPYSNFFIKAHL